MNTKIKYLITKLDLVPLEKGYKSKQMAYEQKEGSGSLFKNEDKKSEKHPDYTGNIKVGGQVKNLAAWLQTSQKGVKYLSLSISERIPKDDAQGYTQSNDLPF